MLVFLELLLLLFFGVVDVVVDVVASVLVDSVTEKHHFVRKLALLLKGLRNIFPGC